MEAVIDVWDVATLDHQLLALLEEHAGEIVQFYDTINAIFHSYDFGRGADRLTICPENPHAEAHYTLLKSVSELMTERTIRAFHFTRLTDNEVAKIQRRGLELSTPESLRRRLDALVCSGTLTVETADQLFDASPFHTDQHDVRSGKFWMASHPINVDNSGVVPLMKMWGGEVASFLVRDKACSVPLVEVGKARIIEVAVPLKFTRHSHAASQAVVASFGRVKGAIPDKSAFDRNCSGHFSEFWVGLKPSLRPCP